MTNAHVFPASFAQQRLWFFTQLVPDVAVYNIGFLQPLTGPCDAAGVERMLAVLVDRHETLRTSLAMNDGRLDQLVHRELPVHLEVTDLEHLDPADRERDTEELLAKDSAEPFDLRRAPLWRARLIRHDDELSMLAFVVHHAVFDAQSARNLVSELRELHRHGERAELPELSIQYADFAAWQRDQLDTGALTEQLDHWRRRLADLPAEVGLPTDRPRPTRPSHRGADVSIEMPVATNEAVRALARASGTTPYAVLLAAFVALLHRLSGRTDVVVGSPVAGRPLPELAPLLGMFVNSLVLRTDCAGDPTFRELVERATDTVSEALENSEVPFDRLVEELAPDRDPSRSPLYQVVLNLMPATGDSQTGNGTAKVDLILDLFDTPQDALGGRLEYATDLFDEATARAMLDRYELLLGAALADPDTPLSRLPLLLDGEPDRLVAARAPLRPEPVVERFRRQVLARPDALAVRDSAGTELTYRELADAADELARRLAEVGAGPERPVALLLNTDASLVVSVLGALFAGAPYVPLDAEHPADRIAHLLADTRAVAIITSPSQVPPSALPVLHPPPTSRVSGVPTARVRGFDTRTATPDDALAYVVYTSGSTGRPKGVGITRGNLAAYVDGVLGLLDPPAGATWAMPQPLTFDFAVTTFYGALLTGGTLCPVAKDLATDAAWLADHRADYLKITPSHLAALLADTGASVDAVLPNRALILGGEASPWERVRELRAAGGRAVINHYGPTETTVGVLALPADDDAEPIGRHTPIGRPMAHAEAHVLDELGRLVPDGIVGELCVGGDTVGRGYLGRPGPTADRFVPDPFSGRPGARLYRTGDRVRRLAGGAVEFLGRADDQVKIRGHRVEPGEVRHVLAAHPAVAGCAVVAHTDDDGDTRLVGYLVPRGTGLDLAAVRDHAAAALPEFMVPSALVVLDELPLTPHGKLDRARLPEPAQPAGTADEPTVEQPSGAVEEVVAGLFGALLHRDGIGRRDNFFALGGHSLLGIRLMTRMRKAFGVALPLRDMFEDPTVAGLAARVAARLRGGSQADGQDDLPAIEVAPRGRPLPASYGQQRLWFLDRFDQDTPLYNTHFSLRLTGQLDVAALRGALLEIVRRHEVLRTRFATSVDGLVQLVHPDPELPFDTAELPAGATDRDRWRLLTEHAARRFDLATDAPLRALLVRVGTDAHELLLTMHHTVFDGSSVAVLVGELAELYPALRDGREPRLPELPVQYGDFAAWQRAVVAGELADGQLAYWRRKLAGLPPRLELPTDRPRPARVGADGQHRLFTVPDDVAARLRTLGAEEDATLFMTLLAGYAVLLRRYTGQPDLAVGVPLITRQRPELEQLIGFFVNTLVLRVESVGDPSFRELVRIARASTVEAYANSDVPFEALVEELAPGRDQGVTPLVQTMFMLADDQRALSLDLGGLAVDFEPFALGYAKFDVSVFLWRRADGLTGAIEYRPDLFDDDTMSRFVDHFVALLTAAAATPDAPLSLLSMAQPASPWRPADVPEPRYAGLSRSGDVSEPRYAGLSRFEGTVVDLVAERVVSAPDAVAVWDGDTAVSYRELWDRAGAIAARLPRDAVVGVCVPRSADLVASLLGVLRAGSAYLPLDPDYPAARLAYTVEDAGIAALVAAADTVSLVPYDGPTVLADTVSADDAGVDGRSGARAEGAAYVLYTSGSTGRPKGVVVGHRALANQLRWAAGEFGLSAADRVAQRTSAGFDASVWELFAPLVSGASVVVTPAEVSADPKAVAELLRRHQVTVLQLVPSLLAVYTDAGVFARSPSLRLVGCGGEALTQELADRCAEQCDARLVNLYGPTECCVQSVFATARRGASRPTVPIGVPVPGVTASVLDEAGRPVPLGVPGELYLGGVQVAHGYRGRPSLTAEWFVPDPDGPPGSRRYRTGDRVRRLPTPVSATAETVGGTGVLEYLGRLDEQVKVRGVRVELGEVRAALAELPGVTQAVAVLRELASGPALLGYVVAREWDGAALRERLRERLPAAALPAAVVVLDELPLLPNGKVDRSALPDPDRAPGAVAAAYVAPTTPTEEVLCGLYERLLGRDRVGVHDDFFAIGGHSLLVTQLVARIGDELGVDVSLRRCFDAPTVAELAIVVLESQLADLPDDDLDQLLLELSHDAGDVSRAGEENR